MNDIDALHADALAQRLSRLDIRTPEAVLRLHVGSRPRRRPGRRGRALRAARQLGTAAAVAASAVVVVGVVHPGSVTRSLPGYTIEASAASAVPPHTTREQAIAVALRTLVDHPVNPPHGSALTGFTVTTAAFEANVTKVWHQCGAHWFLHEPQNLWVVDLSAPPQSGWTYVQASVLVDDASGLTQYSDALISHSPRPGC
jgi:hypothetical protein